MDIRTERWNRIESPGIDIDVCDSVEFDTLAKTINGERTIFSTNAVEGTRESLANMKWA